MSAATAHIDLTAREVVRKISQRSLVIGGIFAVIAVGLAFARPNGFNEFFRAYLLGFMCWLGGALGPMAVLMIRHLTARGSGTVSPPTRRRARRPAPRLPA